MRFWLWRLQGTLEIPRRDSGPPTPQKVGSRPLPGRPGAAGQDGTDRAARRARHPPRPPRGHPRDPGRGADVSCGPACTGLGAAARGWARARPPAPPPAAPPPPRALPPARAPRPGASRLAANRHLTLCYFLCVGRMERKNPEPSRFRPLRGGRGLRQESPP